MEKKQLVCPFEYELKQDGSEEGNISGFGSTFGGKPDSYGDIIVQGAFADTLKNKGANGLGVSMLWQHRSEMPAGVWNELAETKKGLKVNGQLAINSTIGKDAYELAKIGAVKGLSIGYRVNEYEVDEKRGVRYLKSIDLFEISLVTFPANTRATITNVKTAFETAESPRELEGMLVKEGVSHNAAVYLASLFKDHIFRRPEKKDDSLKMILTKLQETNAKLFGNGGNNE